MYKSKTLFSSVLLTVSLLLISNSVYGWERTISHCSGCGGDARAVKVDAAGDVIAIGSINGSEVVKMSKADGSVIWRFVAYGSGARTPLEDLALDSNGDVFVVAFYSRTVIKVSGATGTEMWRATVEPSVFNAFQPAIHAVAVDSDNNVVTAGTISGLLNVSKLRGTNGTQMWRYEREGDAKDVAIDTNGNVAAAGVMNANFAAVKLRGDTGAEIWQREINGNGTFSDRWEGANAVAMDADGSVVVAGVTCNREDFVLLGHTVSEEGNFRDFTVARYLPNGDLHWVNKVDGVHILGNDRDEWYNTSNDIANAVAIDKEGSVIAAGSIQETDTPNSGIAPEHFRIIKFNRNGGEEWNKPAQEKARGQKNFPQGNAHALSVNSFGNIVAAGWHAGSFTLVKFWGSSGGRSWIKAASDATDTSYNTAFDVVMDANSDVIAAGQITASDGWGKFTVIKLRREDGTSYGDTPTPTPTVPETVVKYAPMVYLHPDDDYRPGNPMTFIQNSKLGWSHQSTSLSVVGCRGDDHEVAAEGTVDASRLGAASSSPYSHSPLNHTNLLCRDYGDDRALKASDYTRPFDGSKRDNILSDLEGYMKEGFFLDPVDEPELRRGIGDGAPAFYEYVEGKYVSYWFFYPYNLFRNSVVNVPLQAHEGDWEHISIQLDSNDMPVNVFYSSHHAGNIVAWSVVDKYEGTHPIVFSARGSHAAYPAADYYQVDGPDAISGFDHTDYGPKWSTWNNLLQVEAQPWYGFGGAWGEVGEVPTEVPVIGGLPIDGAEYTGPLGPSDFKNDRERWNVSISISGYVKALNGSGLTGVKMRAADSQGNTVEATYCSNNSKVTCSDGKYSFNLVFGKNYTITPSKEGYNFGPGFLHFANLRGNQTADFLGKIVDTTPPVLSLPVTLTLNATGPSGAIVNYTATANDDRTVNPSISCNPASGSTFSIGITTVTCTAVDAAGNTANGTFKITIKSASAQITDLITVVRNFNLGQSLENDLEKAQSYINQGNMPKACDNLDKLIKNVQKERDKGKLSLEQARLLIDNTVRIKSVIGCT